MNIQSRLGKVLFSQLSVWVVAIVIGSYFMISFDKKVLSQPAQPGILGTIQKYYSATRLAILKRGSILKAEPIWY